MESNLKKELISGFEFMNFRLENNVLEKCEYLCNKYNVEPEDFCNIWFAYAATTMYTDPPTLEKLEWVERKELQKLSKQGVFSKTPKKNGIDKKNKGSINEHPSEELIHESNKNVKNNIKIKLEESDTELPDDNFLHEFMDSQVNSTQIATKYADRPNALSLKLLVGKDEEIPMDTQYNVFISQISERKPLTEDVTHMYEILMQHRINRYRMAHYIGSNIISKLKTPLSYREIDKKSIGSVFTYGRILKEDGGQLDLQSILLEDISTGHTVHLNIDKVRGTALFPGQIVAVKGKLLSATQLIADNLYTDATIDSPTKPLVNEDPIRIIAAAGPYTLDENLDYDVMRDLLNYVASKEPHVLILMGPFVDEKHPVLSKMDIAETFDNFFEELIKCTSEALQDINVQIVVISSMKDISHCKVYPTPPYKLRNKYKNVKCYSDPCILKIDDLLLGITTTDIMYHIAKEELVTSKNIDTFARLASHIIQQRCFYPLYPPSREVNLLSQFLDEHGMMKCTPHMLLLPSKFKAFVRNIQGCVVLNPERITKGNNGGAFADITILPGDTPIVDRVNCKILNI